MAYNEDYYKMLEQEDYKALQNSEMQLENARQRAMKNSQTQLAAQGMENSGYAQTARTGIESQYIQGLEQAQQAHQANVANIRMQQAEAQANNDRNFLYDTVTNSLAQATTQDALNQKMQAFGYMDENGVWTDKYNSLNENDRMYLQSLYGDYGTNIANGIGGTELNDFMANIQNGNFTSKEQMDNWIATFASDRSNWSEDKQKTFDYYYNEMNKQFAENGDINAYTEINGDSLQNNGNIIKDNVNVNWTNKESKIVVGGKTYSFSLLGSVNAFEQEEGREISDILNMQTTGDKNIQPSEFTVAYYDGYLYIMSAAGDWKRISVDSQAINYLKSQGLI